MTRSVQTLLIVDTETTGIDAQQDQLIEIGAVLFSVPHRSVMQQLSFLLPITSNAAEHINGIAPDLTQMGQPSTPAMDLFLRMADYADAIVAHNAAFDRAWIESLLPASLPWICTCEGIRWPGLRLNPSLTDLALAYDVPVWASHRALTDCIYLAHVLQRDGNLKQHIAEGLEPRRLVVAKVSYDDREQAKSAGFRWDPSARQWSRRCSESEISALPFPVLEAEAA